MPQTYRKVVAARLTNNFREAAQIVEVPILEPAPDEILVRNLYAGVNATDVNISAGLYHPGKQPPLDLGAEAAGEIVAVGSDVTTFKPGDAVITLRTGCGYREYQTIKARYAIPIPAATPEVMGLVLSGVTASFGLELVGEMKSGETVLITAAAGGTGHLAVQLAKLAGNHVIGTCGSAEKADMLRRLGCDRVVNYRQEDLDAVLAAEYPQGINLVYESVGRRMFDVCVDHLARRGRLVVIGFISEYAGQPEPVTRARIYHQLMLKSASIRAMFLTHFLEFLPEHLMRLVNLLRDGKLHVELDPTGFCGVESVVDAVEYLHNGGNMGKVIVHF